MPRSCGGEDGPVLYVDYASAEVLRANFRHPGDPADIVEVDIVWGDRSLRECVGKPVDYVVASHVIEHVPDLIGWLLELYGVLTPGGVVCLAVPDRRNTFDIRRPVSLPGEMMEAFLQQHRMPSLRQVFDAAALSKNSPEAETWRAGDTAEGLPVEIVQRLPPARDMVKGLALNAAYVDVHCWVFTASSFLDTAEALHAMGYFPFVIDAFYPTEGNSIEFIVRLKAVADPSDESIAASLSDARASLPAVEGAIPSYVRDIEKLEAEKAGLTVAKSVLTAEIDASNRAMLQHEQTISSLAGEIDALRRSSSWRITAPMRAIKRFGAGLIGH